MAKRKVKCNCKEPRIHGLKIVKTTNTEGGLTVWRVRVCPACRGDIDTIERRMRPRWPGE